MLVAGVDLGGIDRPEVASATEVPKELGATSVLVEDEDPVDAALRR